MYKILVVDDDKLMRMAMEKMISSVEGFEVDYMAKNGKEAVDICKNNNIDIVFMDIMMPIMNGIDATKEILFINPKVDIYIVSSYHNFEMAQSAINSKIKQYVVKPADPNLIKEILYSYKDNKYEKESKLSTKIFNAISERDFIKLHDKISDFTNDIFEISEGQEIKEVLKEVYSKVFLSVFPEKVQSMDVIYKKFPVSDKALSDKKVLSIWMFRLMDYIFMEISSNRYAILKDVFRYIDEKIGEDISLKDIVRDCNISQGYLSRIFKKELNTTIMNYIHLKKINMAKEYLCMTGKSGAEISFDVGYNEFSYFCKVFKKYEGLTVSEYRNM